MKKKKFKKSLLTYDSDIHFKMRSFPLYSSRGSVKKKKELRKRFSYRLHLRLSKHRNLFNQSLDVWKKRQNIVQNGVDRFNCRVSLLTKESSVLLLKLPFVLGIVTGIDNSVVEGFQQMLSVLCVIENQVNEKFENRQWQGKCYFNS